MEFYASIDSADDLEEVIARVNNVLSSEKIQESFGGSFSLSLAEGDQPQPFTGSEALAEPPQRFIELFGEEKANELIKSGSIEKIVDVMGFKCVLNDDFSIPHEKMLEILKTVADLKNPQKTSHRIVRSSSVRATMTPTVQQGKEDAGVKAIYLVDESA